MATTGIFTFGILPDEIVTTDYDEDGFECVRRETYYVIGASSSDGRNFILHTGSKALGIAVWENEDEAKTDLAALDHDPATRPDLWNEIDPTYGSEAWDINAERELACFEADAFGEPRPRW